MTIQVSLQILGYMKLYQHANGVAPTIAEIGRHFDMRSTASVHAHLKKLEEKGLIKRKRYSRVIEIVERKKAA